MSSASRTASLPLAAHAVCAAAGVRDGLRAAQFYIRDLANADRFSQGEPGRVPFLSRTVARGARLVDRLMNAGANLSIALFLPGWRKLPSPFTPGLMREVARGIREDSLINNPTFNAYFYRSAIRIAGRYWSPPWLILEHRVDAARRLLAARADDGAPESGMMARILIALAEQGPVARIGPLSARNRYFADAEPNVAVFSIACVALLLAGEGKPTATIGEDEFFEVTGALIGPRLPVISGLIARRDDAGIARELDNIKSMY
ncbi:MAG: hypothetical protein ACKOED_03880 [Aestuariivirga sp.]|uniref:hypothetical protein n=1 Tax=Aestuariivirga sp. TaxID=2650926 RepID=UPI0038D0A311